MTVKNSLSPRPARKKDGGTAPDLMRTLAEKFCRAVEKRFREDEGYMNEVTIAWMEPTERAVLLAGRTSDGTPILTPLEPKDAVRRADIWAGILVRGGAEDFAKKVFESEAGKLGFRRPALKPGVFGGH